jgi:hypothetical protein
LTPQMQTMLGIAVLVLNATVYAIAWRNWRKRAG